MNDDDIKSERMMRSRTARRNRKTVKQILEKKKRKETIENEHLLRKLEILMEVKREKKKKELINENQT